MDKKCFVAYCRYPTFHTTPGHICGKCKKMGHGRIECHCNIQKKILYDTYKDDKMPNNDWCQDPKCKNKWNHTTMGHCEIYEVPDIRDITEIKVKCPTCKKDNIISSKQPKVFGISDKCIICTTNDVEVFFPNCGHTNLCYDCLEKLSKIQ